MESATSLGTLRRYASRRASGVDQPSATGEWPPRSVSTCADSCVRVSSGSLDSSNRRQRHRLHQRERVAGWGGAAEELHFLRRQAVETEDEVLQLDLQLADLGQQRAELRQLTRVLVG